MTTIILILLILLIIGISEEFTKIKDKLDEILDILKGKK